MHRPTDGPGRPGPEHPEPPERLEYPERPAYLPDAEGGGPRDAGDPGGPGTAPFRRTGAFDPAPTPPVDPARVDPRVLGALLDRHGWRRRGAADGAYSRWTPPDPAAGPASLLVPESRAYPDCDDLLGEALTALARCGAPAAREVLTGLTVPSDEIRWWREVPPGPSGAVPWTGQEQLRAAARGMLLAGALAACDRAGYHGARHRRRARAFLDGVLVGAAPDGRGLTAFVPVTPGRAVTARLHRALTAARDAVDYQRTAGGFDVPGVSGAPGAFAAFDAAVAAGVSRELTEALVALVRGTEGAGVALAWAPAAGVPDGCAARPEPVEFSPGDLPALREAGARYLRDEPSVPVRLTGAVVRLRRSGPDGAGTVRLRVLAGADVPQVRVTLDPEAYRTAGHAHLAGLPLRVSGRLESRGGFRRLTDASGVAPVRVDPAERERLLKALRADDPGEAGVLEG
ncbi:hypothetical protein NX801_11330 [Streptomyces sp. LP05-1]|uniref:Uncharacterized protein n=1 Tax=Streptomyces pyxinae TaxID=2970734 RepID=A0ABT2CG02_9ACTN|nr:hypothetical protein [Streptomyces sp. LP05-1]MCS0636240.1 hypothetical protein [Streptomyces sp. LP05-1]